MLSDTFVKRLSFEIRRIHFARRMLKTTFSLPTLKVSTMRRTSCCARLLITRAARSCKDSYTKKNCAKVALSLLHVSDLPLSGLSGSLSLELNLSQNSAVFSVDAELSGLRRQHEVVL